MTLKHILVELRFSGEHREPEKLNMSKKGTVDLSSLDVSKMSKAELKRVTNKKQRQQLKAEKKLKNLKSATDRAKEVQDIKINFRQWELDERYDAIALLYQQLDIFVSTGQSIHGTIPFPQCLPAPLGRNIVYHFSNVRGHQGSCNLIVREAKEYLQELEKEEKEETSRIELIE